MCVLTIYIYFFKELANSVETRHESHPPERHYIEFEVLTAMTMKSNLF
jgi:hypothetical protein